MVPPRSCWAGPPPNELSWAGWPPDAGAAGAVSRKRRGRLQRVPGRQPAPGSVRPGPGWNDGRVMLAVDARDLAKTFRTHYMGEAEDLCFFVFG